MKLNELADAAAGVLGAGSGFIFKSLVHPERKFRACYKMPGSGKWAITRLDTGLDSLVDGDADRYDFVVPVARVRTLIADKNELLAQKVTIETRIADIDSAMQGLAG